MLQIFYPYAYVESVFAIDYSKLHRLGYRGIIFDIDNTLVYHGENSNKEIDALFQIIQKIGLKTLLLSNNSEKRIKSFLTNIKSLYIANAGKPKVDNYFKAVDMLDIKKEEVVVIGDQIFTDIYGANKSGMANILVKYMRRENEIKAGKKRALEKVILKFYQRSKSYQHRISDIHKEGDYLEHAMEQKETFL